MLPSISLNHGVNTSLHALVVPNVRWDARSRPDSDHGFSGWSLSRSLANCL